MKEYHKISEDFLKFSRSYACSTSREHEVMNEASKLWGALASSLVLIDTLLQEHSSRESDNNA